MPLASDNLVCELTGLDIFATGKWHGDVYTEADLDAMVEAFSYAGFTPPIKLGHSDKQILLRDAGLPAAGWVHKIYRQGNKLLADIKDIPAKIYELIQRKAYDRVSSEVYWDFTDTVNKKTWPRVLKAVALLGADIPEVTTLDAISALYDSNGRAYKTVSFETHGKSAEEVKMEEEVKKMETEKRLKETEDALAEVKAEHEQFSKSANEQSATSKKAIADLTARLEKEQSARKAEQVSARVASFVKDAQISPAQAPYAEALYLSAPAEVTVHFTKDGKTEERKLTSEELITGFINLQPKFISGERTKSGIPNDDVDAKIKAYCKENNLNFNGDGYLSGLRAVAKEV